MEKELRLKKTDCGEQNFVPDDLKFIRSMVEKAHREIDPEAPVMIVWGLVCLIGYTSIYFLVTHELYKWIWPTVLPLLLIGVCVTIVSGIRVSRREKARGVVSHIGRQIGWIWAILLPNALIWTFMGLFRDYFGGFGFLWAAVYAIAHSMTGIIYSKEWLFGGIAIFIAIIVAFFIRPYSYLILGAVMGLACIIPAIIDHRRFRRSEKEYGRR